VILSNYSSSGESTDRSLPATGAELYLTFKDH